MLPGNTIKIVDPLTGETMPLGERGEIAVKGPTLMLGYVGVPHETLGEIVVSCVAPHAGATLSEAQIRDVLKEWLACYKAPRRVLFVEEADLSLTGSSKVKSSAVRELAAKRLSA